MVAPVTVTMALLPPEVPGFDSTRIVPRKFPLGTTEVIRPAIPAGVVGSVGDLDDVPQAYAIVLKATSRIVAETRGTRMRRGRRLRIMVMYVHTSVITSLGHRSLRSSRLDFPT